MSLEENARAMEDRDKAVFDYTPQSEKEGLMEDE